MIDSRIRFSIQVCQGLLNYFKVFYAGYDLDVTATMTTDRNIEYDPTFDYAGYRGCTSAEGCASWLMDGYSYSVVEIDNQCWFAENLRTTVYADGTEAPYSANRSKRAKGPDRWMPAINRCSYAQRWEGLIEKYGLVATTGEIAAIDRACQ